VNKTNHLKKKKKKKSFGVDGEDLSESRRQSAALKAAVREHLIEGGHVQPVRGQADYRLEVFLEIRLLQSVPLLLTGNDDSPKVL
jgi:hypothetical protein